MSKPHFDVTMYPIRPEPVEDPRSLRAAVTGTRNGQPVPVPYEYRRNEAGRDAEIAALVANAKWWAQARADAEDEELRQQRADQYGAA